MRKSGRRWSTEQCARCGDPHKSYSGKLDARNREYVVCGSTNKRMNVGTPYSIKDAAYPTLWTLDNPEEIPLEVYSPSLLHI